MKSVSWWIRLLDPARYLRQVERGLVPRLRTHLTEGESFVGAATAIALAIGLQHVLPYRVSSHLRWFFPIAAGVLLVVLVIGHHGRIDRSSPRLRALTLLMLVLMSAANGTAATRLVRDLLEGEGISEPGELLLAAGAIWLTNVIVFALVFWMFDRGGPAARFLVKGTAPDFLFPQHTAAHIDHADHVDHADHADHVEWEPVFFDYFYTSFTNATAFSPTDVMPLSRWAKFAMMVESALSLMLAVLVIARAVNILD